MVIPINSLMFVSLYMYPWSYLFLYIWSTQKYDKDENDLMKILNSKRHYIFIIKKLKWTIY